MKNVLEKEVLMLNMYVMYVSMELHRFSVHEITLEGGFLSPIFRFMFFVRFRKRSTAENSAGTEKHNIWLIILSLSLFTLYSDFIHSSAIFPFLNSFKSAYWAARDKQYISLSFFMRCKVSWKYISKATRFAIGLKRIFAACIELN